MADSRTSTIRVIEFSELSSADIARWVELQDANPDLDSPYFHPSFVATLAAALPGIRVAVSHDRTGCIESFTPLQISRRSAVAAGFPAADFQGPICLPETPFDVVATMRVGGVSTLRFDHLRDGVVGADRWTVERNPSPYIDIAGGEEGYLSRASRAGRDNLSQARRRVRKAERDLGEYSFVADSRDHELLDQVIELKRSQYRATGARDYFADETHRRLVHLLLDKDESDFGGALSAVYAGPNLLAAHFGMRRRTVLHWWFPVYDVQHAALAPGWILLRALILAGADMGIDRIDLGRGEDEYKRRAMTGQQTVSEVLAYRSTARGHFEASRAASIKRLKSSGAAPVLRATLHRWRRWRS